MLSSPPRFPSFYDTLSQSSDLTMTLRINGFGISRFRSFGDKEQFFGPLEKINIVIGENNSGKSNILRFIKRVYIPLAQGQQPAFHTGDDSRAYKKRLVRLPVLIPVDDTSLKHFSANLVGPIVLEQTRTI